MKFLILLLSFWCYLTLECDCWVVLKFPHVKELYTSERAKYRRRWGGDPFMKKSSRELKNYCNELKTSGIYSMQSDNEVPPMVIVPAISSTIEQPQEIKYQYQKVMGERDTVPMFPCLTHDGYWYLSYGFKDDYLFVFQNVGMDDENDQPIFEVKGLLEKSARLDRNLLRGNALESVLSNAISTSRSTLPDVRGMSLHHFRLCSLVLDAIRKAYSGNRVYTINFGPNYETQTSIRRPLMFQFMNKRDLPSVEAIPCAMNRSFKRSNFFVIPNPKDSQSVFVFLEKEDLMDSKTKYVATYHVRDISALKNWSS